MNGAESSRPPDEPITNRDLSGRTLGQFVLREQIGQGGYGAVYRGEQRLLGREVVVKVLHERRRDEVAQARFLREAQLASQLNHPYAAHVYAFGAEAEDGLWWIAMERVHGITLAAWLESHGPMPLEQFVPLFECIAEVVQAAHERGIVHRDLKPSNVMVMECDGRLLPKLLDFGIAKVNPESAPPLPASGPDGSRAEPHEPVYAPGTGEEMPARMRVTAHRVPRAHPHRLTRSGACMGSAAYMSPEQWCDAEAVGPAADIYSLGVVAYEALTGYVPFSADNTDEHFQQHRYAEPPPLCVDPWPHLDRVIQKALAKYPRSRHKTVRDMASELRVALRVSRREQLRSSAQQWEDQDRPPGLLWGRDMLADLERRPPWGVLSELECAFVAASQRRARHLLWVRRLLVALVAAGMLGVAVMRIRLAQEQARSAQRVAEATVTQAELEQGRSALLHGEPDALGHLAEAYKRDRSPSTAFMLARAMQPRLAEQARFASSFGRMWSAAFSPDGKQIVTTDDKNAQIWDAQTSRLLWTLPHGDIVYQAVYGQNGTRIITAGGDGAIRIWDANNGTLTRELRQDDKRRYGAVAALPDGKLVAAIDITGEVAHVWDTATGALLTELRNNASGLFSIEFSADGRWLATSGGNEVRVFDVRTWAQVRTLAGQRRLSWDPTGPRLLTGNAEGDVSIWAIPSGLRLRHLREIGEPVNRVAFSPNGELVVAATEDGAEHVWDARSGKLRSQGNYLHSKIVSVEFDRTSTLVVAAGANGSVAVTDAALGMQVAALDGPRNVVVVAHFDPSSRRVVGASWDGETRPPDARCGRCRRISRFLSAYTSTGMTS